MVVEAFGFEIERVTEKSSTGVSQCRQAFRVLSQFTEHHREDESPRIIVGAITFGKIRDAENRVLEDYGRIRHQEEMSQLQLLQFPRLLVECFGGKRLSTRRRSFQPGRFKRSHI